MLAVIIALITLLAQPAPPTTVADCLLRSGYSASVTPSEVTALAGYPALEWETVLAQGQVVGYTQAQTDTGRRPLLFYAWGGALYVFVGKSAHDPARRLAGEDETVWHGDCLLKVGADG